MSNDYFYSDDRKYFNSITLNPTGMYSDKRFAGKSMKFWSYVRLVSEQAGYQPHGDKLIKKYSKEDLKNTIEKTGINADPLFGDSTTNSTTQLAEDLLQYLNYRSEKVKEALDKIRTKDEAIRDFEEYRGDYVMETEQLNKQGSGAKLVFANSVNLVLERETGIEFNPNPRMLPTVLDSEDNLQITLPKWPDGAFPTARNPLSLWEVKEFYSSTTFGSRIADAIYEMMLFSEEAQTLQEETNQELDLYLMTDGYEAWKKGVSYICRIIDILNMEYIDAAIFGEEVFTQWPDIVNSWEEIPAE
jgi:hypothetical protein